MPYCDVMCYHHYTVTDTSGRLVGRVVSALVRGVSQVFLYSGKGWFLADTDVAKTESPAEGATSFILRGKGRGVTVLSPAPKHAPFALPSDGFDLFGNPFPKGQPLASHLVYLVARD